MKAFSSIEQSKKLAEILPLESADQTWARIVIAGANLDVPEELQYRHNGDMPFKYYSGIGTPCWSLAALLGVLPEVSLNTFKDGNWNAMVQHDSRMIYEDRDNPVDACYELILKLNKLKLV